MKRLYYSLHAKVLLAMVWQLIHFFIFQDIEKIGRHSESRIGPNISNDDDVNKSHHVQDRRIGGVLGVKVSFYTRRLHEFNLIQSARAAICIVRCSQNGFTLYLIQYFTLLLKYQGNYSITCNTTPFIRCAIVYQYVFYFGEQSFFMLNNAIGALIFSGNTNLLETALRYTCYYHLYYIYLLFQCFFIVFCLMYERGLWKQGDCTYESLTHSAIHSAMKITPYKAPLQQNVSISAPTSVTIE